MSELSIKWTTSVKWIATERSLPTYRSMIQKALFWSKEIQKVPQVIYIIGAAQVDQTNHCGTKCVQRFKTELTKILKSLYTNSSLPFDRHILLDFPNHGLGLWKAIHLHLAGNWSSALPARWSQSTDWPSALFHQQAPHNSMGCTSPVSHPKIQTKVIYSTKYRQQTLQHFQLPISASISKQQLKCKESQNSLGLEF